MATNILSDHDLATEGVFYSTEVENVYDIDIQAIFSTGATARGKCTVMRKTANGAYRTATDNNGNPLEFLLSGATPEGINIAGLNARYMKIKVEIFSGGEGTLNLEYESI